MCIRDRVLDEVDYDTPFSTDDDEFVELLNAGTSAIDLAAYQLLLVDGESDGLAHVHDVLPLSGTLPPGARHVVANHGTDLPPGTSVTRFGPGALLHNGLAGVVLFDGADGVVKDALVYGGYFAPFRAEIDGERVDLTRFSRPVFDNGSPGTSLCVLAGWESCAATPGF